MIGLPEAAQAVAVQSFGIQQQLLVDVDQAGEVVGPLDIADHPVQGVGDTGEHGDFNGGEPRCPCCPPPWEELTMSESLVSATRVRPPGTIFTSFP